MVLGNTRDLFAAIAESSATLTGLLFVAMSLAPRHKSNSHKAVVQQVRAAAALLAFTSTLSITLFGLVADENVGYPAIVVGVIGIFFTAASMKSILNSTAEHQLIRKQMGLIILLLSIFGVELAGGIMLVMNSRSKDALSLLSNVLVASLLTGVARSWELVGERDTGLFSSIAVLSGRGDGTRHLQDAEGAESPDSPEETSPT